MACPLAVTQPENYVPVCASVLCEAPGVIYVSIDPDVWKIRCRQCQEKTEHKCALRKLKSKFRGNPSKRRQPKEQDKTPVKDEDKGGEGGLEKEKGKKDEGSDKRGAKDEGSGERGAKGEGSGEKGVKVEGSGERGAKIKDSKDRDPPEQIPDDFCACADRPKDVTPRANVCLCEIYKPLNFMLELEVSGEFKPAYVPKAKKGKGQQA